MYLLTRLVASFDDSDQQVLARLLAAGFTAEMIDKLRTMPLTQALHFTAKHCGLSIELDGEALRRQLLSIDRKRADQQLYEYFVRAGAAPQQLIRLFGVSHTQVRSLRTILLPESRSGGRPKSPPEAVCVQVLRSWADICRSQTSERLRYYQLHQQHPNLPISVLEAVVAGTISPLGAAQAGSGRIGQPKRPTTQSDAPAEARAPRRPRSPGAPGEPLHHRKD